MLTPLVLLTKMNLTIGISAKQLITKDLIITMAKIVVPTKTTTISTTKMTTIMTVTPIKTPMVSQIITEASHRSLRTTIKASMTWSISHRI